MNAIQFNFKFDVQQIQQELESIATSFNSIHSLKIKENDLNGIHLITPAPEGKKNSKGYTYRRTDELKQCPYLQSILDTFQCDKLVYRVHNLRAKGKIELHRDLGRGLVNKIVRIHIPVTTNEEVYFYVNGERVLMQNGECWLANITELHEVENRSDTDRLQLMIDCDLNDWWESILREHGVQLEETSGLQSHTLEELKQMKENFLLMGIELDQTIIKEINLAIDVKTKG